MSRRLTSAFALCAAVLAAAAGAAQAQDAAAGATKAAMCIGCHGIPGYQASFPEVHRVPMISGQGAPYLVNALTAYRKGDRRHPTMRGTAMSLSDADIADLSAYYASHGASMIKPVADTPVRAPSAEVAALLTRGACASCHGANYSRPLDPSYPKIAGQHADYLFVALRSYGLEGNAKVGRNNPIMNAQVRPYTRAELKAMADYIASLPGELRSVPQSRFR